VTAEDEHAGRIVDRAAAGIADVISRYRADELAFRRMVDGVETWINSLVGAADPEWIDEWRSHWNRLEYVNASMIDEGRERPSPDELEMSGLALDALESMTRH
jgi:hypothetical protein